MLDHAYLPSTGLPYLLLFVEWTRAIAWPLAIAVGLYVFRSEFAKLLSRVNKVDGLGIGILLHGDQPTVENDELKGVLSLPASANPLLQPQSSAAIAEVELKVMEKLKEVPEKNQIPQLVRAYTSELLDKHFALVYARIYAAQTRAL